MTHLLTFFLEAFFSNFLGDFVDQSHKIRVAAEFAFDFIAGVNHCGVISPAKTIADLVSNMGISLIAISVIDIWIFVIMIAIIRHAIQTSIGIGIIIGILCEVSTRLLVISLLSPVLSQ